jgi:predicted lipid-binding transport protein (Tim44 family)
MESGKEHATAGRRRGRPAMRPTVERYELPSRFAELARRRTANIASAWGRWGDYSLTMLCASCYMQGLEDANAAIEARGHACLK